MFTRLLLALLFAITASWGLNLHLDAQESLPPVKVFILAGQSNMEGKGSVETMRRQLKDPQKQHRFAHLQTEDGDQWAERNDVWIHYLGNRGKRSGKLTVGYGISQKGSQDLFGPELGFGWTLGELLDENILIIKTAWGGKSLDRDFRPPSRGLPQSIDEVVEGQKKRKPELTKEEYAKGYGHFYRLMMREVKTVLGDIKTYVPDYQNQGYEVAGFVWFQGWNDQYAPTSVEDYEENLAALINDLRTSLKQPNLPVVIGAMGHQGDKQKGKIKQIADAQAAVADRKEFADSVITVRTAEYWDTEAEDAFRKHWADKKNRDVEAWRNFGNDRPYHYLGSPVFFYNVGVAFAEAMYPMLQK